MIEKLKKQRRRNRVRKTLRGVDCWQRITTNRIQNQIMIEKWSRKSSPSGTAKILTEIGINPDMKGKHE